MNSKKSKDIGNNKLGPNGSWEVSIKHLSSLGLFLQSVVTTEVRHKSTSPPTHSWGFVKAKQSTLYLCSTSSHVPLLFLGKMASYHHWSLEVDTEE